MTANHDTEIDAAAFERELREEAEIVVLDTRTHAAFAEWRLEPGDFSTVNIPEAELAADPDRARNLISNGKALRVICSSGVGARRATALLAAEGIDALSVRGGMIAWSRLLQRADVAGTGPFHVVQFRREARGCLSYLVSAGGEALVVDPAPDVEPYLEEAGVQGVRIVRVFDTHIHADHVSGARELARRSDAVLSLPRASLARGVLYADNVTPVDNGDVLSIGGELVRVLGLPGHTSDMTGLLLDGGALIGGDSLYVDSVARPDLEHGDAGAAAAARELYGSLHERIGSLPGSTLLLSAHWAGGRLDRALVASLATVRRQVDELGLDEDAFVEQILEQLPPKPANFLQIIAVNLGEELPEDETARLEVGANHCAVPPTRG